MHDAGVGTVAIEVSSHALDRREVDGTRFAAVCFTNLSHEHLDYHGSLDAYFAAKARLFDGSFAPAASVNLDDRFGRALARQVEETGCELWSFGLDGEATISAMNVAFDTNGTSFTVVDRPRGRTAEVRTPLVGPFNVSNALGRLRDRARRRDRVRRGRQRAPEPTDGSGPRRARRPRPGVRSARRLRPHP